MDEAGGVSRRRGAGQRWGSWHASATDHWRSGIRQGRVGVFGEPVCMLSHSSFVPAAACGRVHMAECQSPVRPAARPRVVYIGWTDS